MSEILEKAVAAINDKMADCTLIASLDVFTKILDGDMNATEAYMTGSLKVEGSMSAAMELSSLLA